MDGDKQRMYESDHLTTTRSIPANLNNLFTAAKPVGDAMNAGDISNIQPSDYFSYWSSYNSLVIVDYDSYKEALMASVFASHKNSSIIFVNSANLAAYQIMINGKTVYAIGTLDASTQSYIGSDAGYEVDYTLEELQKWHAAETSSDKLILVNPVDLSIELSNSFFTPDKSGTISHLFAKMSLAAPFLAVAKQEVIAYTELADTGPNSGCSANATLSSNVAQVDSDTANAINNLFSSKPKFLRVIAAPRAIPESEYSYCSIVEPVRSSRDWKYGSIDNINFELSVGRIYGVSPSDVSSYIFKSIFF